MLHDTVGIIIYMLFFLVIAWGKDEQSTKYGFEDEVSARFPLVVYAHLLIILLD